MSGNRRVLAFVGGGPRTVSLLERIAANVDLLAGTPLAIHVIDPYPPGGGRIWRRNQSPLLWMNSVARDVTIFTDDSVICEGPIVPGPALDTWVSGPGRQVLIEAGLGAEADRFTPDDFASREFQSLYLSWTFEQVLSWLPAHVEVVVHRQRAVAVIDQVAGRQLVELADGGTVAADLVVLAQGYLDRQLTPAEQELAAAARTHDLLYIPPGYTADVDLTELRAGQSVLVRGFGLAFIDLVVLLFQARGGRFTESAAGLAYQPSGAEPVLHVGSRRGVPYHAKLGYSLGASGPVPPVYFTPAAVTSLVGRDGTVDFRTQLWPLIAKELTAAHYRRLFQVHGERTTLSWEQFSALLESSDVGSPDFAAAAAAAVPDPADRFDLAAIDRPLRNRVFADRDELSQTLISYVTDDLARRGDPGHSADEAVFNALLTVYMVLFGAVVAGQISPQDRVQRIEGEFHGLFSFLASGPPPRRLAELLALHRAGLVQFAGPDLAVSVHDGRFVGESPAVPGAIVTDALVDARLPRPDVRAASDPIISRLLADGELAAEDLHAVDGTSLGGGQLLADASCRAVRADRSVHPTRFLLGPSVSGSAGSAGFSRPGFNGPGFRQNDQVARELLRLAAAPATILPRSPGRQQGTDQPPARPSRPLPARPAPAHVHTRPERIENTHAR